MADNTYVQQFIEQEDSFDMDPDSKDAFIQYLENENADPQSVEDVQEAFDEFSSSDDGGGRGNVGP